ncbi:MAG: AraC family transcriptional regulator [Prevotellaceae bacterium]|nr:AraC family transcriptional regulator [Prevotellaceae bacterium]
MDNTAFSPATAPPEADVCRFSRSLPPAWLQSGPFVQAGSCVVRIDGGEMFVSADFTERHLTAGDCFFAAAGSLVRVHRRSDDLSLRCLVLPPASRSESLPAGESWFSYMGCNSFCCPEGHRAGELTALYMQVAEALSALGLGRQTFDLSCRRILRQMLLIISQTSAQEASSAPASVHKAADGLYERFVHLLSVHTMRCHEVAFYADALAVTQKHLTTTLRKRTGLSAKQCIDTYLGTMLTQEVVQPRCDLKTLAARYGFPTQSYFTQFFVRHTGLPPRAFRKEFCQKILQKT